MTNVLSLVRYQLGGFDVALAGRRVGTERAVVVYLDRLGQPTDRYREVQAFELRRVGTHLAEIKAAIAALPEIRFAWEPAPPAAPGTSDSRPVVVTNWRRLFAHHAIPAGDE